jgi:hypothetical protein
MRAEVVVPQVDLEDQAAAHREETVQTQHQQMVPAELILAVEEAVAAHKVPKVHLALPVARE